MSISINGQTAPGPQWWKQLQQTTAQNGKLSGLAEKPDDGSREEVEALVRGWEEENQRRLAEAQQKRLDEMGITQEQYDMRREGEARYREDYYLYWEPWTLNLQDPGKDPERQAKLDKLNELETFETMTHLDAQYGSYYKMNIDGSADLDGMMNSYIQYQLGNAEFYSDEAIGARMEQAGLDVNKDYDIFLALQARGRRNRAASGAMYARSVETAYNVENLIAKTKGYIGSNKDSFHKRISARFEKEVSELSAEQQEAWRVLVKKWTPNTDEIIPRPPVVSKNYLLLNHIDTQV